MTLTFTPMAFGVRRAPTPGGAYWSISNGGRFRAFWQTSPNGRMQPIGAPRKTLEEAEGACQRHHEAGHAGVAA